MAKVLISVLGTGQYKDCVYHYCNVKHKSKFIQESLVHILCEDWTNKDKFVIALTEGARSRHWEAQDGLRNRFQNMGIRVEEVPIPDGKNEQELWEIFSSIYNSIDEGDEIVLDITHSFRTIPMFLIIILNYAKVLKNIKVAGIYYGAYEAKTIVNDEDYAPIFDLMPYNNLLQWTKGIDTFLNVGSAKQLAEFSKEINSESIKKKDKTYLNVNKAVQALDAFTHNINTCRGSILSSKEYRRSISASYENLCKCIDNISNEKNDAIAPLVPLFDKVMERTNDFRENNLLSTGIATIKWSIENNLTQQGYTVLEETLKTYICVKYGLVENNKDHREYIAKAALMVYGKEEKDWKIKEAYREEVRGLVKRLDRDIVSLSTQVTDKRNDINHYGMNNAASSSENLSRYLKDYFNRFLEIIEWEKRQDD